MNPNLSPARPAVRIGPVSYVRRPEGFGAGCVVHCNRTGRRIPVRTMIGPQQFKRTVRHLAKQEAVSGVGFWGAITNAVKKVGNFVKKHVVRRAVNIAKKVVRHPITKWAARAAAVVYPPVGLPAMAAIETANRALDVIKQGGAMARKVQGGINHLKRLAGRGDRRAQARLNVLRNVAKSRTNPRQKTVFTYRGKRYPAVLAHGVVRARIGNKTLSGRVGPGGRATLRNGRYAAAGVVANPRNVRRAIVRRRAARRAPVRVNPMVYRNFRLLRP